MWGQTGRSWFGRKDAGGSVSIPTTRRDRVRDAEVLLDAGQWSGAYYLAGYAVECGLKACIDKLSKVHDYPDKDFVIRCYTHRIENLVFLAGLTKERDVAAKVNLALDKHWSIVKDWDEDARYQQQIELKAREIFTAISDPANGVLPWITVRW